MKKSGLVFFFILIVIFSLTPSLWAFFWGYYSSSIKGTVLDRITRRPLDGVTISYDVYQGVGAPYRTSYRLFKHIEAKSNEEGQYTLPAVFKLYWLVEPSKILVNCFMPGVGIHGGFSTSKVTVYKAGYPTLVMDIDDLKHNPQIKLWKK